MYRLDFKFGNKISTYKYNKDEFGGSTPKYFCHFRLRLLNIPVLLTPKIAIKVLKRSLGTFLRLRRLFIYKIGKNLYRLRLPTPDFDCRFRLRLRQIQTTASDSGSDSGKIWPTPPLPTPGPTPTPEPCSEWSKTYFKTKILYSKKFSHYEEGGIKRGKTGRIFLGNKSFSRK